MKKQIQEKVLQWANIIETFIAILLSIVIGVLAIFLLINFKDMLINGDAMNQFNNFLETALNLVVGVEFIKMLCRHTPDTVIEVLLFAIARQLVVGHMSTIENLAGVTGIAILFAARKYLLYKEEC